MSETSQQLEVEIAVVRAEIARVKEVLATAFGSPDFIALSDSLRNLTQALARLEAKQKGLMLEDREEVWWRGGQRKSGRALSLPKSTAVYRTGKVSR
jgi:hypothetical protein